MAKKTTEWYNRATWAAVIGIFSLSAAATVAFLSLDTGSWQQYGIAFVLLVIALNRSAHVVKKALHA